MINNEMTLEILRDAIVAELADVFADFVSAVNAENAQQEHWTRGRVDGLLQTLRRIDPDRADELRVSWYETVEAAKGTSLN